MDRWGPATWRGRVDLDRHTPGPRCRSDPCPLMGLIVLSASQQFMFHFRSRYARWIMRACDPRIEMFNDHECRYVNLFVIAPR